MMAWVCMASSDTGLLVFSDDVTEDRSSRKNSEVYRDVCPDSVKWSKGDWMVLHTSALLEITSISQLLTVLFYSNLL